MKEYRFEAIIKSSETGKGGAFVEFPFDVEKEFGTKGRVLVIASFEGVEYRGSLMKMGTTCHMIGVLKEVKQKTGKDIGNVIFAFVFFFLLSRGFSYFCTNPIPVAVQKPSIPKGTRDFAPDEMIRRNYIFDVIRNVFRVFGYQPIETPAMENLSTLLGKYGEEGDKLLFRILNSGNFLEEIQNLECKMQDAKCKMQNSDSSNTDSMHSASGSDEQVLDYKALTPMIAEKGLRYDLTVPFARFVVQHQNELVFPFKRYQIQPVWRADRPQKGRYREFFQCDVDVIGSNSLLNEVELVQIIDAVFSKLGINVVIRLNNRKILIGLCEVIGQSHNALKIITAIDKLEKKGKEGVVEELINSGIDQPSISKLLTILVQLENPDNNERLDLIDGSIGMNPTGHAGIAELKQIFTCLNNLSLHSDLLFDSALARGLSYYTGTIIEVKARNVTMGSICGGGRYDDLTGIFGLPGMSGVGISFGADRISDVMKELNLFPETLKAATRTLFINFGPGEEKHCLKLLSELRAAGIAAELYPDQVKIRKQMEYANRKNIPFVILIGKDEMESGLLTLKDMRSGSQEQLTLEETIRKIND